MPSAPDDTTVTPAHAERHPERLQSRRIWREADMLVPGNRDDAQDPSQAQDDAFE